jgi:hypothetical protein
MLGQTKAALIKVLSPEEMLVEEMRTRHGARLIRAEPRADCLLMVLDVDTATVAAENARLVRERPPNCPSVELVERAAWDTLQRLTHAGILQLMIAPARILHCEDLGAALMPRRQPHVLHEQVCAKAGCGAWGPSYGTKRVSCHVGGVGTGRP